MHLTGSSVVQRHANINSSLDWYKQQHIAGPFKIGLLSFRNKEHGNITSMLFNAKRGLCLSSLRYPKAEEKMLTAFGLSN
jgi:hypothetical protein